MRPQLARTFAALLSLTLAFGPLSTRAQTTQVPGGTQTVTTSTDANGNTVTTTTTETTGSVGGPGVQYTTSHTVTTVTSDKQGREISRHTEYTHEELAEKGGKRLSHSFSVSTTNTDWGRGTQTYSGNSTIEYNFISPNTVRTSFSGERWLDGTKWVQRRGEETTTERTEGIENISVVRYNSSTGRWEKVGAEQAPVPTEPESGDDEDDEDVALPSVAGPTSEIYATVRDPSQAGPVEEVTLQVTDTRGRSRFYRLVTDPDGHISFRVPALAAAIALFTHFTRDREPDDAAEHCIIDPHGNIHDADVIAHAPSSGAAVTRASSSYEMGGSGRSIVALQTRGVDPMNARVLMDGSAAHIDTVAASDMETVGRFNDATPLGRHAFSVESGAMRTNEFPADVVTLRPEPLGVAEAGTVQTVTVHCDGLPDGDRGTMFFQVGGAATLVEGGAETSVPVSGGIAQVRIRGLRSGPALVRYHLHVQISGFWT